MSYRMSEIELNLKILLAITTKLATSQMKDNK